jgi:hypothetical protein
VWRFDRPSGAQPGYWEELFDLFRWKPAKTLPFRRSVAFLVGVAHYDNLRQLPWVESDLTELRNFLLQDGGFDTVFELRNEVVRRSLIEDYMVNKFREDSNDLNSQDRLLFYYSGHGADINHHVGYLQFAKASSNNFAGENILPLREFDEWSQFIVAKHLVIILDACASGLALQAKGDPSPEALLNSLSGEGSGFMLTAGSGDQESFQLTVSQKKGYSVFTHALLEGLRSGAGSADNTGLITIHDVFSYAQKDVALFGVEQGKRMDPQIAPLSRREGTAKGTFVFLNIKAQSPKIPPKYGGVLTVAKGPSESAEVMRVVNQYAVAVANGDLAAVKAVRELRPNEEKIMVDSLKATKGKGYALRNCSNPEFTGDTAKVSCDTLLTLSPNSAPGHVTFFLKQQKDGQWLIVP